MANENGRPWYRDPRVIIPAVVVILAALITAIATIIVSCPEPDFSMSVYPLTGRTSPGGTSQTLVTIEPIGGYKHHVTLEASEQPHGIVITFNPKGGPTPPYSSTINMNVATDVPAGDYGITVKGLGADGTEHTCKYMLTVIPPTHTPDFNISVNPVQGEVDQGKVIETTVTVKSIQGYERPVSLSATGQPSNILIAFIPPTGEPTPAYTSTMTINVARDVPVGDYTIIVKGTGTDGIAHSVKYSLTVIPSKQVRPPTAVVSATPATIEEGESVALSGVDSTDPDGTIVTYAWNFGDDRTATGPTVTHTYSTSGSYTVTLTVTDNDGLSDTATVEITVSTPLVIKITSPKSGDKVPISTIVRGTISGELPEGQYMWVVINPHPSPGEWWPQVRRIEPLKGQWYVEVWLGREEEDVGNEFDIVVILVNEKDDQAYSDYLARGRETGDYPGIPLPTSANIMDVITVIRK